MAESSGMDTFTKRYAVALLVLASLVGIWWISSLDGRVNALNTILRSDPQLAGYPYQFEVISFQDGVAEISSPRSAQVSAMQFLRIVYPELNTASAVDESMMAAQDVLASMQSRAGELVSGEDYVQSIRWSIDKKWYAYHGVYLD